MENLKTRPRARRGVRLHPQGAGHHPARRVDPDRLRLRHPHRGRATPASAPGSTGGWCRSTTRCSRATPARSSRPRSTGAGPSRDWLKIVQRPRARNKIRQWFSQGAAGGRHRGRPGRADQGAAPRGPAGAEDPRRRRAGPARPRHLNYADLDAMFRPSASTSVSGQSIAPAHRPRRFAQRRGRRGQLPSSVRAPSRMPARATARRRPRRGPRRPAGPAVPLLHARCPATRSSASSPGAGASACTGPTAPTPSRCVRTSGPAHRGRVGRRQTGGIVPWPRSRSRPSTGHGCCGTCRTALSEQHVNIVALLETHTGSRPDGQHALRRSRWPTPPTSTPSCARIKNIDAVYDAYRVRCAGCRAAAGEPDSSECHDARGGPTPLHQPRPSCPSSGPRRHPRHRCRPSRERWEALVAIVRRRWPSGPASAWSSRPMFEDLGVFQRVGERTDIVTQGDVRLRGQGRPPRRPAPRGHRAGGAGLRRAPPDRAVEGLVRRPRLPLRAPAGRPLPPAPPGRRRGRSARPTPTSTSRSSPSARRLPPRPRAAPAARCCSTPWATPPTGPLRRRAARATSQANAADLSEQSRETLALNPLRVLDSKRPEDRRWWRPRPGCSSYLSPRPPRRTSSGCRPASTRSASPSTIEPRLVRGLDYYTRTTFEFAGRRRSTSAQNAIGGGGRYDGLVEHSAARPRPASASASGIERILLACDAEGVFAAPDAARRRLRRRHRPAASDALALTARAARGRHRRRPGLRRPEHEGPDEGGRPLGRRGRGDRRRPDEAGRRRGHGARPAADEQGDGAGRGARARGSSTPSGRDCRHEHRPTARACAPTSAATLRAERRRPARSALCGWVARAARARRAPRLRRPARPHRRRPVRRRRRRRPPQRVRACASPARCALRPEGTVNPNLPPARSRWATATVEVLSTAEPPPFPIDARADDVDETVRLRYRYLDLRRERMQRNLRVRAAVNSRHPRRPWSARASSRSRRRC